MRKKIFLEIICLIGIVLLLNLSCGREERGVETPKAEQKIEVAEEVEPEVKPSQQMNDDVYVEIAAYHLYLSEKYEDDPMRAVKVEQEMDKLYRKLGVTNDDYMAFTEKEANRFLELANRASKRAEELKKEEK